MAANAGPIERAGFMDAPVRLPPNKAQIHTVVPIAMPAFCPTALVSVATAIITVISKKLRINSVANNDTEESSELVTPKW